MNLDQALETFIAEAFDLLQAMEDALLGLNAGESDADSVNAIFRAAHTIKGSAGLFGLDHIVAFTHTLESVLDRVRNAALQIDPDLLTLLLKCRDHLGGLIDGIASGQKEMGAQLAAQGVDLSARLSKYIDAEDAGDRSEVRVMPAPQASVHLNHRLRWHVSVRFGPDVLRNGMDPLSFIRFLGTLGELVHVELVSDALAAAADMDAEQCYVGFEIALDSTASREQIENVFEFVRDDCELHVLAPEASVSDYVDLIRALPEDDLRLGEILVRAGTLTRVQLADALHAQALVESQAAPPLGQILVEQGAVEQRAVDAGLERQRAGRDKKGLEGQSMRVDAQKLDQLIDLVGELVIAGSAVGVIGHKAGLPELNEAASTLSRLVEGVRDRALQLRMVQIAGTFNRFKRVVHDVSREIGKEIDLVITGEETELDKTVVEQINDPLTHLVRNSMDHGIEPAELRMSRGKPVRGTVRLNAYHESGGIVIEVSDDGGGLKRDRILAKAVERGLIAADATLSDAEVFNLIFEPGFSTAETITNLSGRGVGLDVVKRNVAALRGTIDVTSEAGRGTCFAIHLPLTLAIIDGFLVRVGKSTLVVPLDMVEECIEHRQDDDMRYVNLRGKVLPLISLGELLGVERSPQERQNVVVVKHGSRRAGIVVDDLLGEAQTVIKPLGRLFQGLRGISGSTILGDGKVALILDVGALCQRVEAQEANRPTHREQHSEASEQHLNNRHPSTTA